MPSRIVICMNIDDKQRLWSKYYLTHPSTDVDNLWSLVQFVNTEVNSLGLSERASREKRKKIMKSMLKFLSMKEIKRRYSGFVRLKENSKLSKNQLIDRLVRVI